ncbi:MAG: serine hydrolase domain-containing protein [Solirubrobacteraceae bacterium]
MSSPASHRDLDQILQGAVASGAVPNVVAVAADRDGVVYEGAAGPRAPGSSDPVGVDSRFRIMSMTKMVVTVAALVLAEQFKLDLDAPVEEYCPEFADLAVLERIEAGRPVERAPAAKATVKQLVTHTSGLGYWFWNDLILEWERATGTPPVMSGAAAVLTTPLACDPGTAFVYGLGTDWLGKVVEAVWGHPLPDAVSTLVTGPLEMNATSFTLSESERGAVVPVHLQAAEGGWAASEIDLPASPDYWSGGHGLYSTPRDYLTFQRMLLGDGTSPDGTIVLKPETVAAAFADQIAPLGFPAEIASADPASTYGLSVGPDHSWGHGLLINLADQPGRRRAGSGAWAGFFNTHFWVDRAAGLTAAIYAQLLPFLSPGAVTVYEDFEAALYASL